MRGGRGAPHSAAAGRKLREAWDTELRNRHVHAEAARQASEGSP